MLPSVSLEPVASKLTVSGASPEVGVALKLAISRDRPEGTPVVEGTAEEPFGVDRLGWCQVVKGRGVICPASVGSYCLHVDYPMKRCRLAPEPLSPLKVRLTSLRLRETRR